MPILYGNIFKPMLHFDKYEILLPFSLTTRSYPYPQTFCPASFWVVHIVKQYICFLFQITKLYIGYAFQTTESVVFPFWESLLLIFQWKKSKLCSYDLWLFFFPFLLSLPLPLPLPEWFIPIAFGEGWGRRVVQWTRYELTWRCSLVRDVESQSRMRQSTCEVVGWPGVGHPLCRDDLLWGFRAQVGWDVYTWGELVWDIKTWIRWRQYLS